jgi:hypothetical protein
LIKSGAIPDTVRLGIELSCAICVGKVGGLKGYIFAVCMFAGVGWANGSEFVVTRSNVLFVEDFNGFRGILATLPAGFSVSLDGTNVLGTTNDFHGVHPGGVTAGGCYAWNTGSNDHALGYQPTSDEFTPGFFMAVISNATGKTVSEISVSYEVVCLNNADRASTLDLEMGMDGIFFKKVTGMSFASPLVQDKPAAWMRSVFSCRLRFASPLGAGQCVWLRWKGDDAGGSSSRDEYGIDNLRIILYYPVGTVITIQ